MDDGEDLVIQDICIVRMIYGDCIIHIEKRYEYVKGDDLYLLKMKKISTATIYTR